MFNRNITIFAANRHVPWVPNTPKNLICARKCPPDPAGEMAGLPDPRWIRGEVKGAERGRKEGKAGVTETWKG